MHHTVKPGWGHAALVAALILAAACALFGCGEGDTSARAMGRYVKKEYGKAELVSEGHEGNTDVYTYKDKEYGFTYQASVRRSRAWFDGPLPWYHTVRYSDFEEQYYACLTALLEDDIKGIEEAYHVEVEPMWIKAGGYTVRDFGLAEVYPAGGYGADLEAACLAVAALYAEKDGRKFWEEGRVTAYDRDACYGYTDIRKKGYFSGDAY